MPKIKENKKEGKEDRRKGNQGPMKPEEEGKRLTIWILLGWDSTREGKGEGWTGKEEEKEEKK